MYVKTSILIKKNHSFQFESLPLHDFWIKYEMLYVKNIAPVILYIY
jgi:hypothetical protein